MNMHSQDRAALALCGVVALAAATVLAGWAAGDTDVAGLGSPYPAQPLTAVGFLSLSLSLLAVQHDRRTAATVLAFLPLAIAVTAFYQELTGVSLGIDTWLFQEKVLAQGRPLPGRPHLAVSCALTLLGIAALATMREGLRTGHLVAVLAFASFGVAAVAGATMPVTHQDGGEGLRYFVAPFPAVVCTGALAMALLGWRGAGWPGFLHALGLDRTLLRVLLPLIVAVPVVSELLERWLKGPAGLDPVVADFSETAINIAAMAVLLLWVTSRASHEQRARRALTRALDSAPIALADTTGKILHWSRGCEELYGWPADQARGRHKYALLGSRDGAGSDGEAVWPARSVGWEEELAEKRADGSVLHVVERARRLEPRHGGPAMVVLSMTDITARTRAEAALRESEERLSLALEANDIGIVEWHRESSHVTMSNGLCRRLGVEPGSIHDLAGWSAHVAPAERKAVFSAINAAIAERRPRLQFRHAFIRPDGTRRAIESNTAFFYDADGSLIRLVGVNIDVTEKEAWESRLAQLQDEVMHVSRLGAMGEMASGLAHELNQPLTAIVNFIGTAKVLRAHGQDEQVGEMLEGASRQALRAGEIIRRMRNFVARGQVKEEWSPVEELISESIALALVGRALHDLDVRTEIQPPDQLVWADRIQIQQVLVNLLRNAAEAIRGANCDRHEIVVTARADAQGLVHFAVRDTGPGLSEKALAQLFTPFVSGKEGGMGVGLSICRRIVKAHGGTLSAGNNPEGGAHFRFSLKSRQEAGEEAA
ncbi:MAG TPA: ATP-binding protein [Allosphingosinicella sp.]|jgi:two-component system sensor kinase FixL